MLKDVSLSTLRIHETAEITNLIAFSCIFLVELERHEERYFVVISYILSTNAYVRCMGINAYANQWFSILRNVFLRKSNLQNIRNKMDLVAHRYSYILIGGLQLQPQRFCDGSHCIFRYCVQLGYNIKHTMPSNADFEEKH